MAETKDLERPAPGSRVKRRRRRRILIAALLLALLAVGYTVLCAAVDTDHILPKNTVNGVDVSGMTQAEAAAALKEDFSNRYADASLTVSANGETFPVPLGSALALDCDALAQNALAHSADSFPLRGFWLVKAALCGESVSSLPTIGDRQALHDALDASGLLKIDTTVQTSYKIKDEQLVFTMGVTGESVDEAALTKAIGEAVSSDRLSEVLTCPMRTGTVEPVDVDAVYDDIFTEPKNATLDPENDYEIVESVRGVRFDKEKVRSALDGAEEGATVAIDLDYQQPDITTQKLKDHLFVDQLGTYTTAVSGTSDRISNVRLAAEKCDGTILLSGDVFSYNDVVGERTPENGFGKASAYLNGETIQEYGGGICQVSSTLYAATLYANLEIVQRQNHTYASNYIGLGMDATVSWGGPDFQFANNGDYPLKVSASYYDGYVTVTIWGTKTDDTHVEIKSETLETTKFSTVTQKDSSMYVGKSYVKQSGHDGYKVQTYRLVYDGDDNLLSDEKEAYSVYSTQEKIVCKGTKQKKKRKKSNQKSTNSKNQSNNSSSGSSGTAAKPASAN